MYGLSPDAIDRMSMPRLFMYALAGGGAGGRLVQMTLAEAMAANPGKTLPFQRPK